MSSEPVKVQMNVEWPGGSESDVLEIERSKWDAMTIKERVKFIEEAASEHAYNHVGWGWYIADPVDGAAAGQP